jgi:predicted peroxiredoxin
MKLGILVNTKDHLAAITGLVRSASAKGHAVTLFVMDEGTRLLEELEFVSLIDLSGVAMSYCDHSTKQLHVHTEGLAAAIERSSQYSNAAMNHNADKVIVL